MNTKERLEELSKLFNRSTNQLTQHWTLVGEDFNKLFELENKIRNNHLHYACGDVECCEKVLSMDYGTCGWNHNHYWLDVSTKSFLYVSYYVDYRTEQELTGKYKGPENKEYFYNYLWNDYVKENLDELSKSKLVNVELLKSLLI